MTGKASRSYELGTPHSITSSARASSVADTVRPSALATVIRRSCYNKAHDLEHEKAQELIPRPGDRCA